jgi:predicted membrane-bound spermidine synthase
LKIPIWKRWWSYVRPVVLEETGSDKNPELTVLLDQGRLQLLSGDAVYSWDDLYRNFFMAFAQLEIDKRDIEEVLVLGLGLGSVPYMLEMNFRQYYQYTAVEWDETVAELAEKYSLSRLESPVQVIVGDAYTFVAVSEEQHDMIVVDIFEGELTPEQFETTEFLELCDDLLRPGGILLFNRLYGGNVDKDIARRYYEETFKTVFPEGQYVDTGGNWVLYYEKPQ